MTDIEIALQHNADSLVQREVHLCLSSMVATLASGSGSVVHAGDLQSLAEQALDLCSPVLDYEEAARQAGWSLQKGGTVPIRGATAIEIENDRCCRSEAGNAFHLLPQSYGTTLEDAARYDDLDPYEWEVYEHWAVSQWLAEKLIAADERVDTNFAGLNIWARTTTGQSISMDGVIQTITRELHADKPAG